MEDIGVFKTTTFGGFDKKSVLTYIDSLNEQHHQAQEEANAKLAEYAKAQESQLAHIHHLEEQLADQEGKLNAVAEQLEQERVQARQALEQIAALEEKNQALEKQVSDGERELQIQLERCRQLQFKAESLDYKSKKYDAMSSQIGDALLDAKRNADAIIADAQGKAEEITAQAHASMRRFQSELSTFKGDSARLRKSIEEILFVLNDRIDVMQEVVRQVEQRFSLQETSPQDAPNLPSSQAVDEAGQLGEIPGNAQN